MGNTKTVALHDGFGQTDRKDNWWVEPLLTGGGLGLFGIYATWAALQGDGYVVPGLPYLSPFYSPLLSEFFALPSWLSPAVLILPFPLLFRLTCYYYRKAYYRAYFTEPPACAVGELFPHRDYKGETAFPFFLQNFHRFTLYIAIIFIFILAYDAVLAFNFNGQFGVGLGSLIMVANVIFLALYTFSCHSWRHLIGGKLDCFSCSKFNQVRHNAWRRVSIINEHHMRWAWISLFTVGFTDLYIRLCAYNIINDIRLF